MAERKYGFKNVKAKNPGEYEIKVVDHKITIAQIHRGPADMTKYRSALTSAEARQNPRRSLYYELVENVLTDGILDAIIDKRLRAVCISPPSLEGTDDEKIIRMFNQPWITELMRHMLESKFWGHSLVEMDYNPKALKDPELEQLFRVALVPRRNVHPEQGTISEHADQPSGGFSFRDEPYVNYLLEFGKPRDLGKFTNIIPYVLFKRNNWSDFAQYNELFGQPLRMYEYDPNQPDTRRQLEEQAKKFGAAAYVIVPKGTGVQHITASTSAGNSGFKEFNSIMNQEMTITVLGQTLTTGADGKGSYALGDVHQDVEKAINMEDKLWVEYQMNWVVKPALIKTFGLNQLRGLTWKFDDTIKLSTKEKAEIFEKMLNAGVPLKLQYIYDELNMPAPDESDMKLWNTLKSLMTPTPQPPEGGEGGSVPPSAAAEDGGGKKPEEPKGDSKPTAPKKSLALMLDEYGMYNVTASVPRQSVTLAYSDDIRAEVERIINAIHAGTISRNEVPKELVEMVYKQLDMAVTTGYGSLAREADQKMIAALRSNTFSFSAAKEFNFIRESFDALVDPAGNVKSFTTFRDEILELHDTYNVRWLETEYNVAVGNSQMASKWTDWSENNDPTDLLKFRAVLDDRSRHKKYNGIILPLNHPAWDYMMPLLDYGCRCTANITRRGAATASDKIPAKDGIKPAFQFNPGKEKMVFSKTHPYWTSLSSEQRENSQGNWGLKKPE